NLSCTEEHLDEILESFKKRVEEGKFIAMPDLQRSIEMRECDHLIDLHENNISYYPNLISKVDHSYNFNGNIKPNQKHVTCVLGKLLNSAVPENYLNNFAFSLYREKITSADYKEFVKTINADGVVTYSEAIELYNRIHKRESEKRSTESLSDKVARFFNE
ncbi:hypothetical protein, partial [Acinetobacter baumannii]|uniref:hypothetical protein n=1 Tax=Acinetobacter baumannii TaxID=470 RepID=UPI000A707695